ncbi:flagellar protein FlaG [Cohnella endophytica]|uniref:Flagellar protein FlaG n=1 Tax=Cohnella endophytica TaxID=2419778 RepID=A0A494XB46_9BACL|nr:flagellar protein FlaG [Cohnella endophytica]
MELDRIAKIEPIRVNYPSDSLKVEHSAPSIPKSIEVIKQAELQGDVTISDHQLVKAIDRAIKNMQGPNTSLEFSVHNKTKEIMVKVLNKDTGEVIREIPPEKTLDFVAKMWKMAGLLVDERR